MEEYIITERSKQNWLVAIITASVLMFSLDYSMLNISLPTIARYFHANLGAVARLPMAYLLVVTSTLLCFGKLGDIKGYKVVFISGLSIFAAGTLLCALSPNINVLLVSRIIQSTGEAMLGPAGMAIVTTFLPDNIKGRALGILATAQGLGIALGSVIGGFINAHLIWRAIFLVNIPFGILTIFLAIKLLPSKQAKPSDLRFDYPGAILISIALAALVYAMNSLTKIGPADPFMIICFIVSPAALLLFIMREKRITHPLLDLKFFNNPNFTFANIAAFFATFLLIGFGFLAPFYLEMARELHVSQAGMLLMIPSLTMMFIAPIAGRLSDKIGSSFLCSLGMLVSAAAFATLSFFSHNSGLTYIMLSLLLLGVGAGIFIAPNNKFVMANAPYDKQGSASGVYKIFLNAGSVFGIALFPIVITRIAMMGAARENIAINQIKNSPQLLEAGFRGAFILGICVCLAGLLFSALAKDKKERAV